MSKQCKSKCPKCGGMNNFDYEGNDIFKATAYHTDCMKCGHNGYFKDGSYQMTPIERQGQHIVKLVEENARLKKAIYRFVWDQHGQVKNAEEAVAEFMGWVCMDEEGS